MEVKFWPKKHVDVEICDIWHDKDAVIVQHTDTLQENTGWYVEALGFKYGIRPTAFVWPFSSITTGLGDIASSDVMKFGVYIPTDYYKPEIGNPRTLPDYASTSVSESGANYYGLPAGTSKPSGFPNQGQELFNFSNGKKGFDVTNGVPGTEGNADFTRLMDFIDSWYFKELGRFPSGGADRQGKIGSPEIYQPYYLGIRSTSPDGRTSYGKSKSGAFLGDPERSADRIWLMENRLTSRWENGFINNQIPTYNERLINGIDNAFEHKGMFNDFVHWHRAITMGSGVTLLHDLYELIYNTVNGRNAWFTGYGESMEYLWFREMASRAVGTVVDDKIHVFIDFVDDLKNDSSGGISSKFTYNRVKTPLTVKIDLSGTILAGKNIKSSFGKPVSLGSNVFLIDVPFGLEKEGFKGVVLSEVNSPNYFNPADPVVATSVNGSTLNVTTDIPCKAVLFEGNFMDIIPTPTRSNELSTTHQFTLGTSNYMLGVISEDGVSKLLNI